MPPTTTADIVREVCAHISSGSLSQATTIARVRLPFTPQGRQKRRITDTERTRIFIRDGFTDRYSGNRLVYPGTIRLLSYLLPDEFPYHPNWKIDACHPIYWELYPTIDHLVPIAHGGADDESNWVSTSMLLNSAKANWTLEELGWTLHPPGDFREWDGLMGWFVEYAEIDPVACQRQEVRRWLAVARQCLNGLQP